MNREYTLTRGERRERQRRKKRRMGVDGSSVKLLDHINRRRAKKIREQRKEYGDPSERVEDTTED